MRNVPAGGGAGTLVFPLHDHLGSTIGVLDATGAVVTSSRTKYWPYGGVRSGGVTQTELRYTGQREEPGDAALGLYNYKARFYSTVLGQFLSSDASTANGYNRYGYVGGNPPDPQRPDRASLVQRRRLRSSEFQGHERLLAQHAGLQCGVPVGCGMGCVPPGPVPGLCASSDL